MHLCQDWLEWRKTQNVAVNTWKKNPSSQPYFTPLTFASLRSTVECGSALKIYPQCLLLSEEMMSSLRLLLKATTQHRVSAWSRKWSLGLLTGEHPTTWMMRKQQQQQQQMGSILVMGWNAFSNVTTTACLSHMCPHLLPYAEYGILSSSLLHQHRLTARSRRRGMLSEEALWKWGWVVCNYLLQCISLWKVIHTGWGRQRKWQAWWARLTWKRERWETARLWSRYFISK